MQNTPQRFFLAIFIYLSVCAYTFFFIAPYSFTSFVGPAAGITTALVIFLGVNILLATAVATVLFCLFLYFWLELPIELSMIIITLLALTLQGFWAKQLILSEVNKQNWLKSRRDLFSFLLKIGPLISLVSAFTVVILTVIDNQSLGENLLFTFANCWSNSILFSIFFTPIFLLYQGRHQLSSSKRFFITLASLLAIVTIGLLFNISQNVQQHQRQDTFNNVQREVLQSIKQEIALTIEQVNSLSAFFKASEQVNKNEFDLFLQHVFQNKSSVRVFEWAPVVNHENRIEFERYFGNINEKTLEGKLKNATKRSRYAPIQYIYPSLNNGQVLGFNVFNNTKTTIDMDKVISHGDVVASAPVSLIQDEHANLAILFVSAVFSEKDVQEQNRQDHLLGFVIAVVQFERFFKKISPLKSDEITLFIEDITMQEPYILFGKQLNESYRHVEMTDINVGSRIWRISLGENTPWQMQEKNWQVWGMLFGATLGGILFQVLILMMAVYSNELSDQVTQKTRELILAKEKSEHENTAKTGFLHTLTNELKTPLEALIHFTAQLNKIEPHEQKSIVQNMELTQDNMQKLLNMVEDLSKLELGELTVNSETLDFYGFIERVDAMLKASESNTDKNIAFLIAPNVPHFINSDELKIQQLLIAFCGGVHQLFAVNNMKLSIKAHHHQNSIATLLFVFTSHDIETSDLTEKFQHFIAKDVASYSTEMAIAKEVCQLMGGDANLAISASGERILTVSLKVSVTSSKQQQTYQAEMFDENLNKS